MGLNSVEKKIWEDTKKIKYLVKWGIQRAVLRKAVLAPADIIRSAKEIITLAENVITNAEELK
jgi:hypothetical protein